MISDDFIKTTDLSFFDLSEEHFILMEAKRIFIKKWNWDYQKSHLFQKHCVKFLQDYPQVRIFITCNHPETLTHGRGLQKPRKGEDLQLTSFDQSQKVPFPLFYIERGGGLTFHHPGQFIFYPILKLNPKTLHLSQMTQSLFDFCIEILSRWGMKDLSSNKKLLGLWCEEKKLASMGIAIERLTTFHGMALNLINHSSMMDKLKTFSPCGLNMATYRSVDDFIELPSLALDQFAKEFLERIQHEWK